MKGNNPNLSLEFANSWKDGLVEVKGLSFIVSMELTYVAIGLSLYGSCILKKPKGHY